MPDYRAYFIGPDGRIQGRIELICIDEDDAMAHAKQLVDGHDVELWQLGRKIATFAKSLKPAITTFGLGPCVSDS
jgi:hypothetical protein